MLDDLFERSRNGRRSDHYGRDSRLTGYRDERDGYHNPMLDLLQKIVRNKVILAVVIVTILVFGALGIWFIFALLPYLGQVISAVGKMLEQQGIKGIMETIMPLLQKIWEGAGK
jgi:hypothetical protein